LSPTLYFKKQHTWAVVSGDLKKPVPLAGENRTNLDAWAHKDESAKYNILLTMTREQQDHLIQVGDDATSKEY